MILIALIGNICTGKSTVAKCLSQLNPNYKLLSIDAFRLKYNPEATKEGEHKAQEQLKKDLLSSKWVILEMSGTSQRFASLLHEFEKQEGRNITVKLTCSRPILLQRFVERQESNYPKIPFPYAIKQESSIQRIDARLQSVSADLVFDTSKIKPDDIAQSITSYVKINEIQKEKIIEETPIKISPVSEILECIKDFDYKKGLAIFKKYLPTKKYLFKRFSNFHNKKHERQLKSQLNSLAASPEKLVSINDVLEVSNISQQAQENQHFTPKRVVAYPDTLQQMIIERGKMINQKKILSNSLHLLIKKPNESKIAVTTIIDLKSKIDSIDGIQKHFERHTKLPKKLERYEKTYASLEDIEHAIKLARSRISKNKSKMTRAQVNGDTELYTKYDLAIQKEEALIKQLTIKKLKYGD